SKIAQVLAECLPDFVIVGLDRPGQRPPICDYILTHYPLVKVLAVAPEHDSGSFFWSDIHSLSIESSEAGILNAIRGKAKPIFHGVMCAPSFWRAGFTDQFVSCSKKTT